VLPRGGEVLIDIVIVKLPNKKSTSTLLALSDAISPLLSCLYQTLDVEDARDTLFYLSRLVSNAWKWSETTEDKGGEQKVSTVTDSQRC
jgi:hypothetical protein